MIIEDCEVDSYILNDMDVTQFSKDKEMRGRLRNLIWRHRDVFKGFARTKGVKHKLS